MLIDKFGKSNEPKIIYKYIDHTGAAQEIDIDFSERLKYSSHSIHSMFPWSYDTNPAQLTIEKDVKSNTIYIIVSRYKQ